MKKSVKLLSFLLSLILVLPLSGAFFTAGAAGNNTEPYIDSTEMYYDIVAGSWYVNYVDYAVMKGFFTGTSASSFEPATTMSRAMLAMTLYNIDGRPDMPEPSPFIDCPDGSWYSAAVTWAAKNGIVSGTGAGLFEPERGVTRQEAAVMLYRYATVYKKLGDIFRDDLTAFADKDSVSAWAQIPVAYAVGAGVINGTSAKETKYLNPLGVMTRAEFATILTLFDKLVANKILSTYYDGNNLGTMSGMRRDDVAANDIIYYIGMTVDTYYPSNGYLVHTWMNQAYQNDPAGQNYIRSINPDAKIILTISGQRGNGQYNTSLLGLTESPEHCLGACRALVKIMADGGFDGLDIDWEFPAGDGSQIQNTALFIRTLRTAMNERGKADGRKYYLTAALPNGNWPFTLFDMAAFGESCDYINLMSYDTHMSHPYALHHTAPYEDSTGLYAGWQLSADQTVNLFSSSGAIPANKILIGCGMYSISWDGAKDNGKYGLGSEATPIGQSPIYHYKQLEMLMNYGFKMYWDNTAKAPFLWNGNRFVSIDNDQSVYFKTRVSAERKTGGLMMFCYSTYVGNSLSTSIRNWLDGNLSYPAAVTWNYTAYVS